MIHKNRSLLHSWQRTAGVLYCPAPFCLAIHASMRSESTSSAGAGVENLVVEGAQVESVSQRFLRTVAQFQYLQLADLVGQGLPGHAI